MFIGGCAGSTSCSIKVIRYILLLKILRLEVEQVFHPNVVRPIRLGGKPVERPEISQTRAAVTSGDRADLRHRLDGPDWPSSPTTPGPPRAGRRGRS